MKRVVSLLLTAILVLSLAMPVFAAEEPGAFVGPEEAEPAVQEIAAPEVPDVAADEPEEAPDAEDAEIPAGGGSSDDAAAPAPDQSDAPVESAPPVQTAAPEDRPDGWNNVDGSWYWYKDGYKTLSDWVTDKSGRYYLDAEGKMLVGLQTVGEYTYFFNDSHNGSYGAMVTGWKWLNGTYYFFDPDGTMVAGDWRESGGDRFYMDEDGQMAVGLTTIGEDTYFFNDKHNGSCGAMVTGWKWFEGAYYFFESDGTMAAETWKKLSGSTYYLDADGKMLTGLQDIDGVTYFFNDKHDGACGAMVTGWKYIAGVYYYFDPDGAMVTSDWRTDSSGTYYLDENGEMLAGWQTIGGVTYYFNEKHGGTYGAMADHQTYIDGEMYMFNGDGSLVTDTTVKLLGKNWTVNASGVIQGYVTAAGRKAVKVLDQVGWNLRSAFNWVVRLTYRNRWLRAPAGAVHTEWYANYGFDNHYGNCFVMNSTLYQMIKMMGYEVYFVEGGVLNSNGYLAPHGWTEVYHNGVQYVYDANFTNETGLNGFRIRYGQRGTWRYAQYKRVD